MSDVPQLRVAMCGSAGVGKTCLVTRLMMDSYQDSVGPTIGVTCYNREMVVDGESRQVLVYDTAGQERYARVAQQYFRGMHSLLFVFSLIDRTSFEEIRDWLACARRVESQEARSWLLVGNKSDIGDDDRLVGFDEANQLALEEGLVYVETSAKTGAGVQEAFMRSVREEMRRARGERQPNTVDLTRRHRWRFQCC